MKQRNIPGLGAVVESAFNTLPVLSAINFLSILAVLYASVREYLIDWVPWINVWSFFGIMCGVGLVLMAIVYIFVLPSLWAFRGKQMFEHESQIMDKLEALQKTVDEIDGKGAKAMDTFQHKDIGGHRWGYQQNCLSEEHAQTVVKALEKRGYQARIMPCLLGEYGVWRLII